MDRLVASLKPASAAVLRPRPLGPAPLQPPPPEELEEGLRTPPDDIERWLDEQQPQPEPLG